MPLKMFIKPWPLIATNAAVFTALLGLMTINGAIGLATIVITLVGLTALGAQKSGSAWEAEDTHFALFLAALPVIYLINMLVLGGSLSQLDKPSRLLLAILLFASLRSIGVSPFAVFVGGLLGTLTAAAVAFYQTQHLGMSRAFGFAHPIPFGNAALLLSVITLAGWILLVKGPSRRWVMPVVLLVALLGLWASAASGSRGGWAALPLFAYILSLIPARIRPWHRATLLASVMLSMTASYVLAPSVKQRIDPAIQETMTYLGSSPPTTERLGSFGTRLEMWRVGTRAFIDHPLMGTGFPGFETYLAEGVARQEIHPEVGRHKHLHNEVITTLAKLGITGLAALLLFWIGGWRYFASRLSNHHLSDETRFFAAVGLLTIGGTIVFSLSDSMFGTTAGISALALLLATAAGGMRHFELKDHA